jgi:hypothetical protein
MTVMMMPPPCCCRCGRARLQVFADFDWDGYYVTLFGFVPLRALHPMHFLGAAASSSSPGGPAGAPHLGQTLKMGVQQVECFPDRAIRSINIQDPLLATNNLGGSVGGWWVVAGWVVVSALRSIDDRRAGLRCWRKLPGDCLSLLAGPGFIAHRRCFVVVCCVTLRIELTCDRSQVAAYRAPARRGSAEPSPMAATTCVWRCLGASTWQTCRR